MPGLHPGLLALPIIRLALRGWVGFAEAASLGWTESIAAGEVGVPSQGELRELLAGALMEIVQSSLVMGAAHVVG